MPTTWQILIVSSHIPLSPLQGIAWFLQCESLVTKLYPLYARISPDYHRVSQGLRIAYCKTLNDTPTLRVDTRSSPTRESLGKANLNAAEFSEHISLRSHQREPLLHRYWGFCSVRKLQFDWSKHRVRRYVVFPRPSRHGYMSTESIGRARSSFGLSLTPPAGLLLQSHPPVCRFPRNWEHRQNQNLLKVFLFGFTDQRHVTFTQVKSFTASLTIAAAFLCKYSSPPLIQFCH